MTRGQLAFLKGLYADPYIRYVRQGALTILAHERSLPKSNNREQRILEQQRALSELELEIVRGVP